MKLTRNIWFALRMGFLGLAALSCFAELTPEQLLERGKARTLFTNDFDGAIADFTLVIAANTNLAEPYPRSLRVADPKAAEGRTQSKTLRAHGSHSHSRQRFGVRQPSGAFPSPG